MSRIDELVEEFAPEGVRYWALRDVFATQFSGYWGRPAEGAERAALAVRNGDITSDGEICWGALPLRGYSRKEADKATLRSGDILLTSSGDCGKVAHLTRAPREPTVATNFVKVLRPVQSVDSRFAYHFLRSSAFTTALPQFVRGAAMTNLDLPGILAAVSIPVPPLEVQREIVRILDAFTELETELEAELEARRQQCAHYRRALLMEHPDIEWVELREISSFTYGYTDKAKRDGDYRFVRITDIDQHGKLSPSGAMYVAASAGAERYLVEPGDLLVARTGATYGKTMLVGDVGAAVYASFLIRMRFHEGTVLPAYYWHFAQSDLYWDQANSLVSGGAQPQFNANVLKMVRVPVPPMEEQRRVVERLDKFDALVNDLSSGLPAEIAARRQQYAYYRDRLLTFKEAVA